MKIKNLKQVHIELIYKDYGLYWKKTGVNDRLFKYQKSADIAEFIVQLIDIGLYVYLLIVLMNVVIALVEQSAYLFDLFTIEELTGAISINLLYVASYISLLYGAIRFLYIKTKHRLFRYEICEIFKVLCASYLLLIVMMFCTDFLITTWIFVLSLLLVRKSLLLFTARVNKMMQFATSERDTR